MYQLGPGPYPEDLGIVENGDKATHAISQGQYVIWKGVLKKAKEAIQVTGDLSSTNLANVANGLGGEVKSLSDQIANYIVAETVVVPGNGTDHNTVSAAKSGYTPIAAIPTSANSDVTTYTQIWSISVNPSTNNLNVYWTNAKSSSVSLSVIVLYVKN